jgi:hypothetical protein
MWSLSGRPGLPFIDVSTPEGKTTGLLMNLGRFQLGAPPSIRDTVAQVLGTLSPVLLQKLDACLKVGLGL